MPRLEHVWHETRGRVCLLPGMVVRLPVEGVGTVARVTDCSASVVLQAGRSRSFTAIGGRRVELTSAGRTIQISAYADVEALFLSNGKVVRNDNAAQSIQAPA